MNKVESMLLELKDTSEFMVDLAYSSLLYNNVEIAEEVIFLEGKMDELSIQIQQYIPRPLLMRSSLWGLPSAESTWRISRHPSASK